MRSPVNPVASLVAVLTLAAGLPAIASAQDAPFDPGPAASRADTLARTPSAWAELAQSDGRIAFGVKGGGARRPVTVLTPFGDAYGMELAPSSPVPFGLVHRFGQREWWGDSPVAESWPSRWWGLGEATTRSSSASR